MASFYIFNLEYNQKLEGSLIFFQNLASNIHETKKKSSEEGAEVDFLF